MASIAAPKTAANAAPGTGPTPAPRSALNVVLDALAPSKSLAPTAVPPLQDEWMADCKTAIPPSVGAFIHQSRLQQMPDKKSWKIALGDLDTLAESVAETARDNNLIPTGRTAPTMSDKCVFRNQKRAVEATGFLVHPSRIVATVGHFVFSLTQGGDHPVKPNLSEYKFVFNLTQDYMEGGGRNVDAANVWGIESVLAGQCETFEDLQNDGWWSVDGNDVPDCALVRLKPLEGSVLPAPYFKVCDPRMVTDQLPNIIAVGHPWAVSLKLSAQADANLRTTVLGEEASAGRWQTRDGPKNKKRTYVLANVFKHNLRVTGGNSGGPILLVPQTGPRNNLNDFPVVGIQSTQANPGGPLEQRNFCWDSSDPSAKIEPVVFDDDPFYYRTATRNNLWSSLVSSTAEILLVVEFKPKDTKPTSVIPGKVSVGIAFKSADGAETHSLVTKTSALSPVNMWLAYLPDRPAGPNVPAGKFLTADITAITVTYTAPPSSKPATGVADMQLEAVQAVSRDAGDKYGASWTPILNFTGPGLDVTLAADGEFERSFARPPYIPRSYMQEMAQGQYSLLRGSSIV